MSGDALGREDFERWIAASDALRVAVIEQTRVMLALDARLAQVQAQLGPGVARDVADGVSAAVRGLNAVRDIFEGPAPGRRRR